MIMVDIALWFLALALAYVAGLVVGSCVTALLVLLIEWAWSPPSH